MGPITARWIVGVFAVAQSHFCLRLHRKTMGSKLGSGMGAVAHRLLTRATTCTPGIIARGQSHDAGLSIVDDFLALTLAHNSTSLLF